MARPFPLVLFALAIAGLPGCTAPAAAPAGRPGSAPLTISARTTLTRDELAALGAGFADNYVVLVGDACEQIMRGNPSVRDRRIASRTRLATAKSAYDIVTNSDPFTALLDLTVNATLQHIQFVEEGRAVRLFGEQRGAVLANALTKARNDVWQLDARVMTPEQTAALEGLIRGWRKDNPEVETVTMVRFREFAASRGRTTVEAASITTILLSPFLAPVNDASRAVDEMRLLAERAFFLSKRMPTILAWQAEAMFEELLRAPVVDTLSADLTRTSGAVEKFVAAFEKLPEQPAIRQIAESSARLSMVVEKLPEQPVVKQVSESIAKLSTAVEALPVKFAAERQELVKVFDERAPVIREAVKDVREALAAGDKLGVTVGQTSRDIRETIGALESALKAFDRLMGRFDKPAPPNAKPEPPGRPFNITEYTAAAAEIAKAAHELTAVFNAVDGVVQSQAWKAHINDVQTAASQGVRSAADDLRDVVDHATWRGLLLLGALFVLLTLSRIIAARLAPRNAGA